MNKLKIINNNEEAELNFEKITYLYGQNGEKKEEIIQEIFKYFNGTKNSETIIYYNNEEIGKSYFDIEIYNTIFDVELELNDKKGTNLNESILNNINSVETIEKIDIINFALQEIIEKINEKMEFENYAYEFESIDVNVQQIVKNNIEISLKVENKKIRNIEKIKLLLDLILSNYKNNPKTKLIIFNNIDVYINSDDFKNLISLIEKNYNIYEINFIFSTSKIGFTNITEKNIDSFNVINKGIFNLKNIDESSKFINENYPINKIFDNEEIIFVLNEIAQNIYSEIKIVDISSNVILKMINKDYGILHKKIGSRKYTSIECFYLQHE